MTTSSKFSGAAIAAAAVFALGSIASTAALAQTSGAAPASRAAVKAEARAANRAGIPAGDQNPLQDQSPSASTGDLPRGEVKSEARAANQAGTIPYGQGVNKRANAIPARDGSVQRPQVKADAKKAPRPFGATGERSDVVTNPATGGTPK